MAPATRTTCPFTRASIRPPAAGLSIVMGTVSAGFSIVVWEPTNPDRRGRSRTFNRRDRGERREDFSAVSARSAVRRVNALRELRERDRRQSVAFAHESVDGRIARACERLGGHPGPESRQLLVGFMRQRRARGIIERLARL